MASKQCSKRIVIDGVKVPLRSVRVFAVDGDRWVRVRHRRDVPSSRGGSAVTVAYSPAGASGLPPVPPRDWRAMASRPDAVYLLSAGLPEGWQVGVTAPGPLPRGRAWTGQGGLGFAPGPLEELRSLSATFRAGSTFYETAEERAERRRRLARLAARHDPAALTAMVRELREQEGMRSASLMLAVDAVHAGLPGAASLLDSVMQRPDEPGTALQYSMDAYGRIPRALRLAAGRGAVRLYDEAAVVRFDRRRTRRVDGAHGMSNGFSFADVLRVTHAVPADGRQGALFDFVASGRVADPSLLPLLASRSALAGASPAERAAATAEALAWSREVTSGSRSRAQLPSSSLARALVCSGLEVAQQGTVVNPAVSGSVRQAKAAERVVARALRQAQERVTIAERRGAPLEVRERRAGRVRSLSQAQAELVADRLRQEQSVQARRSAAAEIALPFMGYKSTLMALVDLGHASEQAREFARGRVSDAALAVEAGVSLSDVMRALKAVSEDAARSGDPGDGDAGMGYVSWNSSAWTHGSTWVDGAVSTMVESLVGDRLEGLRNRRVLVLVDGSGSMFAEVSTRGGSGSGRYSGLTRAEVAAFVASAVATVPDAQVDVVAYDTKGTLVPLEGLDVVSAVRELSRSLPGGATDTEAVTLEHWSGHDVVVTLTDEQTGSYSRQSRPFEGIPPWVGMVTCNLAGDAVVDREATPSRVHVAGMSDVLFDHVAAVARAVARPVAEQPDLSGELPSSATQR